MKRRRIGRGFFGDIGSAFRRGFDTVKRVATSVPLISTGLALVPHPAARVAAVGARALGLGKKRRRRRVGRGFPIGAIGPGSTPHGLGAKLTRRVPIFGNPAVGAVGMGKKRRRICGGAAGPFDRLARMGNPVVPFV